MWEMFKFAFTLDFSRTLIALTKVHNNYKRYYKLFQFQLNMVKLLTFYSIEH